MAIHNIVKTAWNNFRSQWLVCRLTSGKESAQYGIRFSYPVYILMVTIGVLQVNPYILSITALIALLGIVLPMHPFDYIYNFVVAQLFNALPIPGRGSELQFNSAVALLFNLVVIVLVVSNVQLNYGILAGIYLISSVFFITIQLLSNEFSIYSIYNFFSKKWS